MLASTTPAPKPRAQRHLLHDASRADHRHRGQHRRRQDEPRQPGAPAVRPHVRQACCSTASTCATSTRNVLWSSIGLVPQKPYLFSGTVASNLRFGKPDATEAEMWEALEVAQAEDFVRAMPGGLDARIEQGGTNVSRRAAPASRHRAGARSGEPEIYVFDDSFSALDLATDARLRAALGPYTARCRRASSWPSGCRPSRPPTTILVLEDGEMVGRGTHDDLIATCATYAEIVQSQIGERRRRMTVIDETARRATSSNLAAPETRAAGRWKLRRACPREQSKRLQERGAAPRSACSGPSGRSWSSVAVVADRERGAQRAGPAGARARHRHRSSAASSAAAASTSAGCTTCCTRRWPSTSARRSCRSSPRRLLAGVVQRLMFRLRVGGRGQGQRPAAALHRQARNAATCSAASPTTSTTSPRACSRR